MQQSAEADGKVTSEGSRMRQFSGGLRNPFFDLPLWRYGSLRLNISSLVEYGLPLEEKTAGSEEILSLIQLQTRLGRKNSVIASIDSALKRLNLHHKWPRMWRRAS